LCIIGVDAAAFAHPPVSRKPRAGVVALYRCVEDNVEAVSTYIVVSLVSTGVSIVCMLITLGVAIGAIAALNGGSKRT